MTTEHRRATKRRDGTIRARKPHSRPQSAAPAPLRTRAVGARTGANGSHTGVQVIDSADRAFYLRALDVLDGSGLQYCVAGAYCLAHYAGIVRHTKDLDIFIRRRDVPAAFRAFEEHGFRGEMTHPHWLGKVYEARRPGAPRRHGRNGQDGTAQSEIAFVDLIFRSANGMCVVDDEWLDHAEQGDVLGRAAPLCPVEEMIWSKSWVMARERFDGADIAHVLLARADRIDWDRLLHRFQGGEEILLGHLVFFHYIYPSERGRVPMRLMEKLFATFRKGPNASRWKERVCRGTNLSWDQYDVDVEDWNYADGRRKPWGPLTAQEIKRWTRAPK